MKIELPKGFGTSSYELTEILSWETDFEGCGPTMLELCEDSDCSKPLVEDIVIEDGEKDNSTGQFNPRLVIEAHPNQRYMSRVVFIRAYTNNPET